MQNKNQLEPKVITNLSGMMRQWFEAYMSMAKPNATAAARKVGYKHPNKSGPKLLQNPKIIAAIEDALRQQTMSREKVLARLSSQASAEQADYYTYHEDLGIHIKISELLQEGLGHLIKEIRNTEYGQQIIFHDAQTALIQLGRYYKLFTDKIEETSPVNEAIARALDEINGRYPTNL